MTKTIRAALLMLALSVSTQAGDGIIQNGSPAAAPTPTAVVQEESEPEAPAKGIIQNGLAAASEATLVVLQSLLTLL